MSRWPHVVEDVVRAFPATAVTLTRVERDTMQNRVRALVGPELPEGFRFDGEQRLNAAPTVEAMAAAAGSSAGERSSPDELIARYAHGAKFDPLTEEERSGLARRYATDLDSLERAGKALFALLMVLGVWLGTRWGLAAAAAAIVAARILLHLLLTQLALALLGLRWRRLLRCHAPALWVAGCSAAALWAATGLAERAALPTPATLAIGLAAWAGAAAAAVHAAPGFARPRSVPWLLVRLPFPALGATGRLLRVILERLDPAPASRNR